MRSKRCSILKSLIRYHMILWRWCNGVEAEDGPGFLISDLYDGDDVFPSKPLVRQRSILTILPVYLLFTNAVQLSNNSTHVKHQSQFTGFGEHNRCCGGAHSQFNTNDFLKAKVSLTIWLYIFMPTVHLTVSSYRHWHLTLTLVIDSGILNCSLMVSRSWELV